MQLVGAGLGLIGVMQREAPEKVAVVVFALNLVGVTAGIAALWL